MGSRWFEGEALRLLEERNRREVDAFEALIQSHQQLLLRGPSQRQSLAGSSSSMRLLPDSSAANLAASADHSADALAQRHLQTIQRLERELSEKNAELARYAGSQLKLVNESKELLQMRQQWEFQLDHFTKRLQEEMLLNEEKDRAMRELDGALGLLRDELARHQRLLESTERANDELRQQLTRMEEQLLRKSQVMQEWLEAHEPPDVVVATGTRSSSSSHAAGTQEMAEALSRVALTDSSANGSNAHATMPSRLISAITHSLRAHATEVNSVCFNASGKILFSGSSDGTVRAWDATAGLRPMGEYRGVGTAHPLLCVRVAEDGELVLGTGCDRKCFVWRVATGRVQQTLTGHKGRVLAAEFSPATPNEVWTGSSDRSLRIWDVSRGQSRQSLHCRSSCNDLAMVLGGLCASAHHDGAVRFWDPRARHVVHEATELHRAQVTSVSYAGTDDRFVLTNARDHTLALVDTRTFGTVRTLAHAEYQVGLDWAQASLSPDGRFALAGGANGGVFCWNTDTGRLETLLTPPQHLHGAIACCVWRPDGDGAATCDKNGVVAVWE